MHFAVLTPFWHFPVVLSLGPWRVPIHPVCDFLAYGLSFRFYLYLKKRSPLPQPNWEQGAWILLGAIFGALIGAKLLAWAEAPALYWALRHDPNFWYGGKTIVGALLGGWIGIELAKKGTGVATSTGDLCVYPLILGMCIGRIGCFLTGLSDNTCGTRTSLPWGVDYGDGIPRHPTQIYEILFLLALGGVLWLHRARCTVPGQRFRWFLLSYLAFRLVIDSFKPHLALFAGLSGIQWACLVAIGYCLYSLEKISEPPLATESAHV